MTDGQVIKWLRSLPDYRKWAEAIGEYDPCYDYSGPENNRLLSALIPSTLYGINCNPAFYVHDALFRIGGDDLDRRKADGNMLIIGLRIIEEAPRRWWLYGANWLRRSLAKKRLLSYYNMVRAGGESSFNYTRFADA
jgi:hypothetical protein